MEQVVVAVLLVLAVLIFWRFGPYAPKEHADLAPPSFDDSLVDKYRSYIKDNRGWTVNDYALEAQLNNTTALSDGYRIM